MKKILKILFSIMIGFFIIFMPFNERIVVDGENKIPNSEYKYIMIQQNEWIAVYKINDFNCPIYMFEFDTSVLSDKEKEDLKIGIFIKDSSELKQRLDDFSV